MSDFRTVQYDPQDPLQILMTGYEDTPELAHWGPGKRANYIVHFVTKGQGFFGGTRVQAGQGFLIPPSLLHEYHAAQQDGWQYFWMILSDELATRYLLPLLQTDEHGVFDYRCDETFIKTVRDPFRRRASMGHLESLSAFFAVVSCLSAEAPPQCSAPLYHIQAAKVYIAHNLHKKLTVKAVADAVYLDDRYLYKIFAQHEGIALKTYIDRCKLAEAQMLLTESAMSIGEIAAALGFDSVCTFSKFFSAKTGQSPSAARKHP